MLLTWWQELLHTVQRDLDDFAWSHIVASRVIEVDVAMALGGHCITLVVLADHDGCAAIVIAGRDETILGEDEHRAGTFHLIIYILDTVNEVLTLRDEQGDQFRGIGEAHAQLGEVLLVGEAMVDQLVNIVDFAHRDDGELAEVRVDDDGLRVGVADDADAYIADKFIHSQLVAELRPEIGVLDVVYRTMEHRAIVGHQARPLGAKM